MKTSYGFVAGLMLATASLQPACAAHLINGSFESGVSPGSMAHVAAGAGDVSDWVIGGNSVDYVGSFWTAADGQRSIDLSGSGAGNIAQTFATSVGVKYIVTFLLAGNPDAGPLVKTLSASATGNAAKLYKFDASHSTHANMGWIEQSYLFTAKAGSTTLRFASLNEGSAGPALDNITVRAVPEVGSWLMMVGGFGMLGLRLRKNKAGSLPA